MPPNLLLKLQPGPLGVAFSLYPHDSLIDKEPPLPVPPPTLPLTCLHALFIGVFISHIGLAWIVRCLKQGALSISLQRISPLPCPRPLEFYACVPGCESECTLSQVDRAFIHSTLKVCRKLAAIAVTDTASVSLPLSLPLYSIFQTEMLACAKSSQGFGPLTGRLWGIMRARTEEDERERGTRQHGAL